MLPHAGTTGRIKSLLLIGAPQQCSVKRKVVGVLVVVGGRGTGRGQGVMA